MISQELLNILICPACGAALLDRDGRLECTDCRKKYPVQDGIPDLLVPDKNGKENKH